MLSENFPYAKEGRPSILWKHRVPAIEGRITFTKTALAVSSQLGNCGISCNKVLKSRISIIKKCSIKLIFSLNVFIRLINFYISSIALVLQQFLRVHTFYYYLNLLFRTLALSINCIQFDKGACNSKPYKIIWQESKTLKYYYTFREHCFPLLMDSKAWQLQLCKYA